MKINKFNESKIFDEFFPFKCKIKDRTPDPGLCWIIEINFEDKKTWSNGIVRSIAPFEKVEFIPDIFMLTKYNI